MRLSGNPVVLKGGELCSKSISEFVSGLLGQRTPAGLHSLVCTVDVSMLAVMCQLSDHLSDALQRDAWLIAG